MGVEVKGLLESTFGYAEFKVGQEDVINSLINNSATLAVFPTGGGKSICYQLPALIFNGLTLVISPLLALMKDQIDFLQSAGVAAARLDSTLDKDQYKKVIQDVRNGKTKILYIAPERFNNEIFRNVIREVPISLFAIDEAHCISEWGHNFRPDYLKLSKYAKDFNAKRVLCLTATANREVEEDIKKAFKIDDVNVFRNSSYRENLDLSVIGVEEVDRDTTLLQVMKDRLAGPMIIYVTLQKTTEKVSELLQQNGYVARAYHAGQKSDLREITQNWFMKEDNSIIVATIAFGMGIDKSNIRNIVHYNLPKSIENYYQEIGRAGRDGKRSKCTILLCNKDIPVLETFAIGDAPEEDMISKLVSFIFSHQAEFNVVLSSLKNEFDIKDIVIKTIMTSLELQGYVEETTPQYVNAKLKYLVKQEEILKSFDSERRKYLEQIFLAGDTKSVWTYYVINEAVELLKTTRKRFLTALDFLNEKGMIEMLLLRVQNRFIIKRSPDDLNELKKSVHAKTSQRLQAELDRIDRLVKLLISDKCIHDDLSNYFLRPIGRGCGHCSFCCNHQKVKLRPYRDEVAIDVALLENAYAELEQHPHIRDSKNRLIKYLLGIRSPYVSSKKLIGGRSFGALENYSWYQVEKLIRSGSNHERGSLE